MFFGYVDYSDDGRPFYVGIGNEKRLKKLHRNKKHDNVRKKHGQRREVMFMSSDWEATKQWEIWTIEELKTFYLDSEFGCNFTRGGDGAVGFRHSEETKQRHSESSKIAQNRPDVKQRQIEVQKIVHNRPDVKQKKSEAMKIVQNRPDVKQKKSEAIKIAMNRPDVKQKMSEAIKIAMNRPDVKQKMSESLRKNWADPAYRQRRIEARQQKS